MHLGGSGSQQPFDVNTLNHMPLDAWHLVLTMRNETISQAAARLCNEATVKAALPDPYYFPQRCIARKLPDVVHDEKR